MRIIDNNLGTINVNISIEYSAVDSYITSAYSVTLGRDLTEKELDLIQDKYADQIQLYSYENGSRDHNWWNNNPKYTVLSTSKVLARR